MAAAFAAVVAWQATRAYVSLDFFRDRMEATVRARLPADAIVTIGATAFSYRSGEGFILRARDVELALPGRAAVKMAELSTVTDAGAVFSGAIDLTSITVSGVDVGVSALGGAGGLGGGTGGGMIRKASAALAGQIAAADDLMRGAGLQAVVVRDAALRVIDHAGRSGPALRIAEANWLPLGDARSKTWLQVAEASGASWDLTVERRRDRLGGGSVTVELEDLPVASLAPDLARAPPGRPYYRSAAVTLLARMATTPDGTLSSLRGNVSTGAGQLSLTGKDRIEVAGMNLSFSLGASGDRLSVPDGRIETRTGNVDLEGVADLSEAGQVTVLARVRSGRLPGGPGHKPVTLTGGGALARFNLADLSLAVERFHLLAAEGRVSAVGQVSFGASSPGLSFALSMTQMPAEIARAFWPPTVATKTRAWFDENVKAGTFGPATLQVALPLDHIGERGRGKILPSYALVGTLPFRDGVFSPIKTFPKVTNAAGTVAFGNATATVRVDTAMVGLEGKGTLDAAGTEFVIPELGRTAPVGNLRLQISGPAAALATLADTPPLGLTSKKNIDPNGLSGDSALALDAGIPLEGAKAGDIRPTFRLTLTDFSSAAPIENRTIANADMVLEGSPETFTVKGDALLDGMQASVDLILGSAAPGQTDVTLSLDEAARERLGLKLGGFLRGPVQASIRAVEGGKQQIALDLKDARITAAPLGWEKGPGVPATALFTLEKDEQGTRVSDIVLSGKGFGAKGSLILGPDNALRRLDLTEVALRPGDRLSATLSADGNVYDLRLRGSMLDVRGLLRGLGSGTAGASGSKGSAGAGSRVRVSVDLDGVRGQNDVVLADVSGSMVLSGSKLETAQIKGRVNPGEPFEWTLGKESGARALRVFAGNGGALISFGGIYSKVAGGDLILDYSGTLGGAGTGVLVMRDFRVLNEAALDPAVETARRVSNDSDPRRPAQNASRDLRFNQIRVPFRQEGWVITIDDAALRGPMIGATGNGTVNVPGGKIAISGSFIPAFGINNIAGAIPLIGTILGGGRDEGLVGITYKLFGPLGSPKLTMNPISAIAPGIFRKIFEYN